MSIKIDLKIILFILLLIATTQIQFYGIIMLFALLHEIGHLLIGLFLGLKPQEIKIMPLGFSIDFKVDYQDYNYKIKKANRLAVKKIAIAFAGPIMNLMIIWLLILFSKNLLTAQLPVEEMIYANILILIFNLLPIYPLDGGRVFKEVIYLKEGLEASYRYTYIVANICTIILTAVASIVILSFHNIAIVFIILYLWYLRIKENKKYEMKKNLYDLLEKEDVKKMEVCIENKSN